MATLSLTLIEIIVLMLGAITLGITIHFFIVSRKSLKTTTLDAAGKIGKDLEQWKLKYFNDIETRDRELSSLKQKLEDTEENNNINAIEADEMRKMSKKLQAELNEVRKTTTSSPVDNTDLIELQDINEKLRAEIALLQKEKVATPTASSAETDYLQKINADLRAEIETLRKAVKPVQQSTLMPGDKAGYMEQLRLAQNSLLEHNQKISQLLGQIDIVKENEEKQLEIEKENIDLTNQVNDLKFLLTQKEEEISATRKKENITTEMTSRLDSAYNEFNTLQEKIYKLEAQVIGSKKLSLDYEDLQETYQKASRDFEEQKIKYNAAVSENQLLHTELADAENNLREANFQRQQLQKRVAYLEELNNDMQAVAEANKKLEGQLKRVGELESRLNMIAEERDELARKQFKAS